MAPCIACPVSKRPSATLSETFLFCQSCKIAAEKLIVHCWWECGLVQPLWKMVWNFLKKLRIELPFDPAIPLLGLYPKNPKSPIQKNLCTPVFIAVLFTIAKCWKQPQCLSVNEWIKKLWYIYTMKITHWKERMSTFCNSIDRTGEYYAKWNEPVGERQIPYDLTYKRNVMNKIN